MTKTTARHIYFAGAVSAKDYDTTSYQDILKELNRYGELLNAENYDPAGKNLNAEEIFMRMEQQLEKANIIVADVSTPSNVVGREIAYAQFERKIPVLCVYKVDCKPSPVIEGNVDIDVFPYENIEDIKEILKTYFTKRL